MSQMGSVIFQKNAGASFQDLPYYGWGPSRSGKVRVLSIFVKPMCKSTLIMLALALLKGYDNFLLHLSLFSLLHCCLLDNTNIHADLTP